jgi:threonine dehydratase
MAASRVPDLADVLAARQRIAPHLQPTPLYRYPALDAVTGTHLWVKHENHQPVGAFKVRGGVNLVSQLSADERQRGVIAASTGNHGQSVAYAADLFGVRAVICVPQQANPVKVESMQALGAEVVFYGRDFDEAREHCEQQATEYGYRYIHSGNEPSLIAGVATCTMEILQAQPGTEVIVVPVGGGSGAAGACVVAKAVRSSVEVIGVQSEAAPAAYRSWQAGTLVEDTTSTFAEGLATRTAFELPQQILRELLDDFVLVSEEALKAATRLMIEKTRNLVEPAGAAAPAVRGPEGGGHLQRRQHQPGATSRTVAWRTGLTSSPQGRRHHHGPFRLGQHGVLPRRGPASRRPTAAATPARRPSITPGARREVTYRNPAKPSPKVKPLRSLIRNSY